MSKIMYRMDRWSTPPIEEVTLVRETKHFHVLLFRGRTPGKMYERREAINPINPLFPTWEEARAFIVERKKHIVEDLHERIAETEQEIAELTSLKDPTI